LPSAAVVQRMFKGIPQSSNTLGGPKAPVTLAEYIDLQCPYCGEFESTVLPRLVSQYVRTGKVRIEQRLLAFIGPDSARGRSAAVAAGMQNKQFNFSELLYLNQGTENTGWLDEQMVVAAASSVPGLRVPKLLTDAKSSQVSTTAKELDAEAKADAVNSTPTILVGPTGGKLTTVAMSSPTDYAAVSAAITTATG
jgi:protein-disulfide isomerase